LGVLQALSVDYTHFFRTLSRYDGEREPILKLGLYHDPMNDWLDAYDRRLECNQAATAERHRQMLESNPKYVLKNYMLQEAIDAAQEGDYGLVKALFEIARSPYDEHPEYAHWAGPTPQAFKNDKLSCSS
jgi:uncharacterized protein YdiU (UPF0061 family)